MTRPDPHHKPSQSQLKNTPASRRRRGYACGSALRGKAVIKKLQALGVKI